jgi:hypothetical protein
LLFPVQRLNLAMEDPMMSLSLFTRSERLKRLRTTEAGLWLSSRLSGLRSGQAADACRSVLRDSMVRRSLRARRSR